jgi:hypothetical protein
MARARVKLNPNLQPELPGLFHSDYANDSQYVVGNISLGLIDEPHAFGRLGYPKRAINRMAARWDLRSCDPVRVVYHPDTGRYESLDGTTRVLAARRNGITELPCRVERPMTVQESADMILKRQNIRRFSQAEIFRNEVVAGYQDAVELRDILEEFELYVYVDPVRSAPKSIRLLAISSVKRVHARLHETREILNCIDLAWSLANSASLNAEVIAGTAEFWARYHDKLSRADIIDSMKKTDPVALRTQADQLRGASRPRMYARDAICSILKDNYNYGRKANRIP